MSYQSTATVPDAFVSICPSRRLVALLGEKWTILIIIALHPAPAGFGALQRQVQGVSKKMLTQVLRRLETHGLVARQPRPGKAALLDYVLTPLGLSSVPILTELKRWAEANVVAALR